MKKAGKPPPLSNRQSREFWKKTLSLDESQKGARSDQTGPKFPITKSPVLNCGDTPTA